jgi:hypothetical protein
MVKVTQSNIAVGLNRGHVTIPLKKTAKQAAKVKQARRKPILGRRVKLIRQVIDEVLVLSSRSSDNLHIKKESSNS